MSETQKHTTRNGFIAIIGTYIIWGLLPLYFVVICLLYTSPSPRD